MTFVEIEGDKVFLLNPRHAPYVTGESPSLREVEPSWLMRGIMLVLVVISIGLFVSEFVIGDDIGEVIEAEIVEIGTDDSTADIIHFAVYRFTPDSGSTQVVEEEITREVYNQIVGSETVNVRYLPNAPDVAQIDIQPTQFFSQTRQTLFLLTALVVLLAYILIFRVIRPLNRTHKLEAEGMLLKAQMNNAYPTRGFTGRAYVVNVDYRFTNTKGETIRASARRNRNDLRKVSLPGGNTPVTVLYVNDKLYRLM